MCTPHSTPDTISNQSLVLKYANGIIFTPDWWIVTMVSSLLLSSSYATLLTIDTTLIPVNYTCLYLKYHITSMFSTSLPLPFIHAVKLRLATSTTTIIAHPLYNVCKVLLILVYSVAAVTVVIFMKEPFVVDCEASLNIAPFSKLAHAYGLFNSSFRVGNLRTLWSDGSGVGCGFTLLAVLIICDALCAV